MIPNDSHETAREPIMPIDWNDPNLSDETVVRAAVPNVALMGIWLEGYAVHVVGTRSGAEPNGILLCSPMDTPELAWKYSRQHPTVVAFEKANRRREPITAEICNTCLHPEHEGQCRATAACLCIQFPSLHPTEPDLPVQEAAGDGFEAWEAGYPEMKAMRNVYSDSPVLIEHITNMARAAWTACAERKSK